MLTRFLLLLVAVALLLPGAVRAQDTAGRCGSQSASGALCADTNCCSQWGYCGAGDRTATDPWCGDGCQSGPCAGPVPPPPPTISPKPTPAPNTPAPFSLVGCQAVRNTVNFGYYESWAKWRGCNPVAANAIDVATFGYTHLAYSFASISSGGLLEEWSYGDGADYALFNSLKGANPTLKTLIAVGGWTFDQTKFSDVASTAAKRSAFAASVVTFCDTHNFDGIDFDWEYPVTRQGTPADYANYPLLLQAVRQAFDAAGHGRTTTDPWLITVATSINTDRLSQGYDLVAMTPYVDWFNMMSYDIYGAWDSTAGANADMPYITTTMQYIFDLGIPREKLVLGLAAYGRSTRLASPSCVGTQGGYTDGCPVTGGGLTGCHGETGNLPYFEIKENYVDPGNYDSLVLNTNTGSMEMISGGGAYFTSFDNDDTFNIKYQYAYAQCMRGIMWWAVDLIKEPIVFTATLQPTMSPKPTDAPTSSSGPTTSPKPTKAPTPPPTSPPTIVPPCGVGCPVGATGNYATVDCAGFHMCNSGAYLATFACAPDTLFDETLGVCNYATAVNCACTAPTPPPTPPPTKFGVPATPPPTSPPTTPLLPSSCTQCDGSQFMVAGLDCLGFHYCNSANLGNYVACPVNTLYNEAIMGCDWDYNVNCQCYGPGGAPVPAPGPAPAPSPVSPPTGPTPIGSPTTYNYGCPTTCTGGELVSAIDCTGFCQCTNGAPAQYVPCGAGSRFDYSLQTCNYDSAFTCTYLSGGPLPPPATPTTPATTPPPTPPTAPIPAGSVYYPDWERSATCSNDGRQPNWMGAPYFFPTLQDCCNAWFWWQLGSVSGPCYGPF